MMYSITSGTKKQSEEMLNRCIGLQEHAVTKKEHAIEVWQVHCTYGI